MDADRRPMLHELLKRNQEPFHLKSYIAERRSELRKPPSGSSLRKFNGGSEDFLRIPSETAAILAEAAIRIQKQPVSKPGMGLFGSFRFLKRLSTKKRASDLKIPNKQHRKGQMTINLDEIPSHSGNESSGFTASTSRSGLKDMMDEDFTSQETQFYCSTATPLSPVRFSLRRSLSYTGIPGRRTPDFTSPAASPSHPVNKENEECDSDNPRNSAAEEQEEKEQCSPVSILDDTPFEEAGHVSRDEEEEEDDDYQLQRGYANIQRAKQQLLHRLRRFEKLAGLDLFELETTMIESPDEEFDHEFTAKESEICDESFDESKCPTEFFKHHCKFEIWRDEKVCDAAVRGQVQNRLGAWKEVEAMVDSMIDLDFEIDLSGGWRRPAPNHIEELMVEMELEIFHVLVEEFLVDDDFIHFLRIQNHICKENMNIPR